MKNGAGQNHKASFSVPGYITRPLNMTETLSRSLATKIALKLFFKPIAFPVPKRENDVLARAIAHNYSFDNKPFRVLEWGSGEKTVLIMHGWSGRATQFFRLIDALLKNGYRVLGIEAPGHGKNLGPPTHLFDFIRAIDISLQKHGPAHFAVGHSLGGVAVFLAHKQFGHFQKIVVAGSPATSWAAIRDFCKKVGLSPYVAYRIKNYLENRYDTTIWKMSLEVQARKADIPGLVLHDRDDLDVDYNEGKRIAQNWPGAKLITTNGLGHRYILHDEQTIDQIAAFLK